MFVSALFQSTPSGGKATVDFKRDYDGDVVSIHAFRGEGDRTDSTLTWRFPGFNPRLPGGRRPAAARDLPSVRAVSIHAFRGEGDGSGARPSVSPRSFNPRLPGGRRRNNYGYDQHLERFQSTPSGGKATDAASGVLERVAQFQSTPSGGKATGRTEYVRYETLVSIHAFRGEGDLGVWGETGVTAAFQSTPSGGKATSVIASNACCALFQSTPSGGKATVVNNHVRAARKRFNPRLPGGRRPRRGYSD